jgi:predicted membrane-bound dolichyl-phosphate-mannose-protein mannosyltransferase
MWQMRLVPCMFGTLLVPGTYYIVRLYGTSRAGSICAAFFVATDNMMFTLSRIHLLDILALCSIAAVVYCHARCLMCAENVLAKVLTAERRESYTGLKIIALSLAVLQGSGWLLLTGVSLGGSVSSKFGIAVPTAMWCILRNGMACARWACCCATRGGLVIHRQNHEAISTVPLIGAGKSCSILGTSYGNAVATSSARALLLFTGMTASLAATALLMYWALLVLHFSLIPWKNAESGSYASYALTKKRVSAELMTRMDRFFEALVLGYIDFRANSHGVCDKVVDFTIDQ